MGCLSCRFITCVGYCGYLATQLKYDLTITGCPEHSLRKGALCINTKLLNCSHCQIVEHCISSCKVAY
jgi:hypothetical protein